MNSTISLLLAAVIAIAPSIAQPQEAALRKNLIERLPNLRKIEEVRATPLPGIFEVRYAGNQILYADEKGDFIISGSIIDTRTKIDLTEARIEKLLAVEFDSLPLSDAILIKQGTGARRIAVFVDPNCGYCKRFERDLAQIGDLSIYTFLIPILGADSNVKARDIWCAKDSASAWRAWMLDGVVPLKASGACDAAVLARNLEFAQRYKITGTPATFFADGTRKPGAISGAQLERLLVAATTSLTKAK